MQTQILEDQIFDLDYEQREEDQGQALMLEQDQEKEQDFAELLDEYMYHKPRRGEIMTGEVLSASEQSVFLDVGVKRTAIVPRNDLESLDDEQQDKVKEGKELPVYVLRAFSPDGELLVSLKRGFEHEDWIRADRFESNGKVVETEVIGKNRGGLLVKFGTLKGFVPRSHLMDGRKYFNDPEEIQSDGTAPCLDVKVIEVDRSKQRLILSEKAAYSEVIDEKLKDLFIGQLIKGKVKRILDFGAFLDLGGFDGLLHVSEMDTGWVDDPNNLFDEGDEIEVIIKDIDLDRRRVSLTRKDLFLYH